MNKPPLQDIIVKSPRQGVPREQPLRVSPKNGDTGAPMRGDPEEERQFREPPRYRDRGTPRPPKRRMRFSWLSIALIIGAVVLVTSFVLSLLFAGATVTAYVRHEQTHVDGVFTAQPDTEAGALQIKWMTIERSLTKEVTASDEQQVEERASGKIAILNGYASQPQRLIKNTRFQSESGKIYRIRESVEVPGKTTSGGKEIPGQIEVTVYAEEPGEDYNIDSTTFTIPGFKGKPQYEHFTAKSVTPLTGGFKGKKRTVDDAARLAAYKELEQSLHDALTNAAFSDSEKPDGYLLYKDMMFFEFTKGEDQPGGTGTVQLVLNGKLHVALFPEGEFASFLAQEVIAGYDGNPIKLENPDALTVREPAADASGNTSSDLASSTDASLKEPWNAKTIQVEISGDASFIWTFDEAQLRRDLAGKNKSVMQGASENSVLAGYPGIDRAEARVRPFWRSTFPEDPNAISIVTALD